MIECIEKFREALPVEVISNVMLAIILALLINYVYISTISYIKRSKDDEIMKQIEIEWSTKNHKAIRGHNNYIFNQDSNVNKSSKLSRRERKRLNAKNKKLKDSADKS